MILQYVNMDQNTKLLTLCGNPINIDYNKNACLHKGHDVLQPTYFM